MSEETSGEAPEASGLETMHERTESLRVSLREQARAPAGEDADRVLRHRAEALARPVAETWQNDLSSLLIFRLGRERLGIESRCVLEVFRLQELARLPGATPPLFGVTPWRGDLLTLIDLRQALGTGERPLQDLGRVLVLGEERAAFGVLADAVEEMVPYRPDDLHPLPPGGSAGSLVRGMTAETVLVLDGQELLRTYG
jgi:purine-binding chemotaxis protein CheW